MKSSIYFFLFSFLFLAACEKELSFQYIGSQAVATDLHSRFKGKTFTSTSGDVKVSSSQISFTDDDGIDHRFKFETVEGKYLQGEPYLEYEGFGYLVAIFPFEVNGDEKAKIYAIFDDTIILTIREFDY